LGLLGGLAIADVEEAYAGEVLRILWEAIEAGARKGWRPAKPAPFQSPEVLQSILYGYGLQGQVSDRDTELVNIALSGEDIGESRAVCAMWLNEVCGSPSRQRELERQPLGEYRIAMSLLSYARARLSTDPDGPRYRGLGNAVTVPVIRWLGERIIEADEAYV
tara:strand:- start:80 stop:568 length:489 start_codon:yes stop_codon:yes gene_type:complete